MCPVAGFIHYTRELLGGIGIPTSRKNDSNLGEWWGHMGHERIFFINVIGARVRNRVEIPTVLVSINKDSKYAIAPYTKMIRPLLKVN